jgi:hypothetical protein
MVHNMAAVLLMMEAAIDAPSNVMAMVVLR